jgi:hypothetical protein
VTRKAQISPSSFAALPVFAAFTLLHLFLVIRFPLASDETYYWEWSRHPGWGYYDQGPMIAWWIRASCLLFGDTPLGIRFGIVLAALAMQILLYLLARDLFGSRAALLSLLLVGITPLALAGSFIATYDPLLALFWAWATYCAARALFFGSRRAWIGAGAAFGLGLLSKHTMLLFAPCLLLFLLSLPEQRAWLRRPHPYVAALVALAIFAPNLWWQSQHDWMTFRHLLLLTDRGVDQPFLRRLGDFAGSQAGLITPLLFLGFTGALLRAGSCRRKPGGSGRWFLFAMSAPVLLFFLLLTVKSKVQANWAITGWLTPPLLFAAWMDENRKSSIENRQSKIVNRLTWWGVALSAVISLLLIWPEARRPLGLKIPQKWDAQMNKLYGGEELGAAADRVRRAMREEGAGPVAIGAATYDNASRLAFYMPGQPRTHCFFLGTRLNSYVLWNDEAGLRPGGSALVADDRAPDDARLPPYRDVFQNVVPEPRPVTIYRRGVYDRSVHVYYLYRCYDYRPDPATEHPRGG